MSKTEALVLSREVAAAAAAPASLATKATKAGVTVSAIPVSSLGDDPRHAPSFRLAAEPDDIFAITPHVALQLLCASVEALVRITGDVPPTPPLASVPRETNMRDMEAEKASIVRTLSANSLSRLREQAERAEDDKEEEKKAEDKAEDKEKDKTEKPALSHTPSPAVMEIDGVHLRTPTAASPSRSHAEAQPPPLLPRHSHPHLHPHSHSRPGRQTPEPYIVIGADSQPLNVQHSAISRKFYSKAVPPFSISQYLTRLHRYCPMSTAVYLATSLYIYRLAVTDKVIAVTRRNAHRLLLAGLRVAMKALEDRSHPHAKMSKVGGVSEAELARLEIHFCFLVGFDVTVQADQIQRHWLLMKRGEALSLDDDETVVAAD